MLRRTRLAEKVAAVDELATDEVGDRHLGVLRLTLDPPFGHEQLRSDQRCAVTGSDVSIDDQVRDAELILERHEDDALAGPGSNQGHTELG